MVVRDEVERGSLNLLGTDVDDAYYLRLAQASVLYINRSINTLTKARESLRVESGDYVSDLGKGCGLE